MVFGRAGEEIEALVQAGIAHEVVPGITSAQALAARLGVSLTHRDAARSLRFVTGHGRDGALPADLDWRGLADPSTTLVVYMGTRTAAQIACRLIEGGLSSQTAACAVAAIGRPEQSVWHGPLDNLEQGVGTLPQDQPILFAIGDAAAGAATRRETSVDGETHSTEAFEAVA